MWKFIYGLLTLLAVSSPTFAQNASLHGQVTDQSGAVVAAAKVTLSGPSGPVANTTTANDGAYSFTRLASGNYTVEASAPGLVLQEPAMISVGSGAQTLDLELQIAPTTQQVNVEDIANTVSPEAANNASAVVLRGTDLQALSDDPTQLEADLQALAGPAAGPSGGEIFVDGFSGGELPSKDTIREVKVNQNPFSPEYDKLGLGRIEILTKPGSDTWHGSVFHNLGDDVWNSRNAYAAQKAPFLLREWGGNVGGPLSKHASFFLDVRRDAVNNGSIINGVTLAPTALSITPFTQVYDVRQRAIRVSPRLDYQLSANHTLSVKYGFSQADVPGAGIGSFNLVDRGYDHLATSHTTQIVETAVVNPMVVNEVRFQFFHLVTQDTANTISPAIQVLGAFNAGGASMGHALDTQDNYELQESVSIATERHTLRFGARLRGQLEDSILPNNFAGTFTFGGGIGPKLDANNQPVLDVGGSEILIPIQSIEQYRRTLVFQGLGYSPSQIRALGGEATQFTLATGNPALSGSRFDISAFFGDDWRVNARLTLSFGLRYETQTNIHDWRDFAPRISLAWAPGKGSDSKTVLRAGFGVFYDRFDLAYTMAAERYNGVVEQQYVIANPDFFPSVPSLSSLAGLQPAQATEQASPDLRAPYVMQSAFTLERQLPLHTTLAITYANSHGLHLLRSRDVNAALPGTFNPNVSGSGVYPMGNPDPVFLMESTGLYNQNQLIFNVNARVSAKISLNGNYTLSRTMSNTDGLNTFSANPYSMAGEYGPAATDVRNRALLSGTVKTKWNVQFNPFVTLQSGLPFNITTGQDLYGTTLFNGRPGIVTDPNKAGVIQTQYGLLDPNPSPGETILPRNYGRGPGAVLVNLTVSKTIGLGHAREPSSGGGTPASASSRYSVTVALEMRNIINHNNPGPIIGNITSPLFGQANQPAGGGGGGGGGGAGPGAIAAGPTGGVFGGGIFSEAANNRRLELQTRFSF